MRYDDYDPMDYTDDTDDVWYCAECREECTPVEITFDYAGTHCTGGRPGTHHTGHYTSNCCDADIVMSLNFLED